MAERTLIDRLDDAIDAILADRRDGLALAEPELAMLLPLVEDLRGLPDPRFRTRLGAELSPRAQEDAMTATTLETTTGYQTITPYCIVHGAAELIEFLKEAFGGEEIARYPAPDGRGLMHAEVRVGDSMIEMGDASAAYPAVTMPFHIYVDDADATYRRALAAGAESLMEPVDQPYGDREAGVRDRFGNHWYIATHVEEVPGDEVMRRFSTGEKVTLRRQPGVGPRPKGFRAVTVGFSVVGAAEWIEFVKNAFGAEELDRTPAPDGKVMHAELRIGDSIVETSESHGPWKPMQCAIHLYVDDADAVYARAVAAGAISMEEPMDRDYGERSAFVTDPFGNQWFIATPTRAAS